MYPNTLIVGNFIQWTGHTDKKQRENMKVKQQFRSNAPNISTEHSTETTEDTHSQQQSLELSLK